MNTNIIHVDFATRQRREFIRQVSRATPKKRRDAARRNTQRPDPEPPQAA